MKLNHQLIEQIRNGKAIHYDIDNVELLNEVLHEACTNSKQNAFGGNPYYVIHKGTWIPIPDVPQQSIPLSSFLTQDKQMVSVEEVLEFLKSMRIDEEAYKANGQMYAYGVTDTINNILEALNKLTTKK